MAYLGTTSTAPNVPNLLVQPFVQTSSNVTGVAGLKYGFPRIWNYASTHGATEIVALGFFSKDAQRLGWVTGDVLFVYGSSGAVTSHGILSVSTTAVQVTLPTVIATTV